MKDPVNAHGRVAQDDHGDHMDGVRDIGLGLEIDANLTVAQIHDEDALVFLALPIVARQHRGRVLPRQRVLGVGRGLEGELIQGYDSGSPGGGRGDVLFSRALTLAARLAGRAIVAMGFWVREPQYIEDI